MPMITTVPAASATLDGQDLLIRNHEVGLEQRRVALTQTSWSDREAQIFEALGDIITHPALTTRSALAEDFASQYPDEAKVAQLLRQWESEGLITIPTLRHRPVDLTSKGREIYQALRAPADAPCWP